MRRTGTQLTSSPETPGRFRIHAKDGGDSTNPRRVSRLATTPASLRSDCWSASTETGGQLRAKQLVKITELRNRSRRARTQKFPSYVEAYEEIRTLADRRSRRALRPLVQHPDERVPIALWHARARNQLASHVLRWLNHALAARAIADARAAGVLWTPLMDAMGQSSLWYGEHSTTLDKELEPADIRPKPGEHIEKQRVRWIQEQTDPAVLLRLINDFPSFGLHREVAREARVLSDELIKRLRSTARMDATLIANRALPDGGPE